MNSAADIVLGEPTARVDPSKTMEGAIAELERWGLSRLHPYAAKFCPAKVALTQNLEREIHILTRKYRRGEIPWDDPDRRTPRMAVLDWFVAWLDILEDVRPLAEAA